MRLFLAIYPPKNVLDQIRDTIRLFDKQKRNLKKTPIDQIHLTLKFLGPGVSEESKDDIVYNLRNYASDFGSVKVSPTNITLGFPRQSNPEVLILNVNQSDSLSNLANIIHETTKLTKKRDIIRWKDKHSKHFHITLARLKKTATQSNAKQVRNLINQIGEINIEDFEANEFFLLESTTDKGVTSYKKLERFEL